MADVTTITKLDGLFKEQYANDIINLIPEVAKLTKLIKFVDSSKENGGKYHQPVIVSAEQGVTYANADSGAFELEGSITMSTKDAQVTGNQMVLRSAMSYEVAAKASNNKKAFVKATSLQMDNMLESATKRLEIAYLYGQSGLGESDTVTAGGTSTQVVLTLVPGSWSTGIWSGMKGAALNLYLTSNDTLVNGSDPRDAAATLTVISIDAAAKTITCSASSAGNATAFISAGATANCNIFFRDSHDKEMAGLRKIMTNTGVLFNIDAATVDLWKSNTKTYSSGTLTFARVLACTNLAVQRGLDEKVVVLVNPSTWSDLASDLAALRRFDSSYSSKKGETGVEGLLYHGQNGDIEIVSHNIVKEADCFIFPPNRCKRIGAQEVSFNTPGLESEGKIFMQMGNNAGYEYRLYTDQAIFLETPPRAVFVTGFVNSIVA